MVKFAWGDPHVDILADKIDSIFRSHPKYAGRVVAQKDLGGEQTIIPLAASKPMEEPDIQTWDDDCRSKFISTMYQSTTAE